MLRELLPLGAVIKSNRYVEVLMLDQAVLDGKCNLPAHFLDSLCAIHFLSHVLAAAQGAQKEYGVPASVLIAKAMKDCCWGEEPSLGKGNHFGDRTQCKRRPFTPRETKLDFIREAKRISHHPKYRLASSFIECRCEYTAKLSHYGIIRDRGPNPVGYALDIMSLIVRHALWNCDVPEKGLAFEERWEREQRERDFEENFGESEPTGISAMPRGELQVMPRPQLVC